MAVHGAAQEYRAVRMELRRRRLYAARRSYRNRSANPRPCECPYTRLGLLPPQPSRRGQLRHFAHLPIRHPRQNAEQILPHRNPHPPATFNGKIHPDPPAVLTPEIGPQWPNDPIRRIGANCPRLLHSASCPRPAELAEPRAQPKPGSSGTDRTACANDLDEHPQPGKDSPNLVIT